MCTSTILGPRFPHKVGHSEVFLSLKQVGHARTVSTSTYVQFSISSPPLSTQPVLIMGRTTPKERLWAQKQALKGESIHHVADVLRTSVKSLQKYWPTHGKRAPPVDDKPRSGRPRKLPGPIITSMKKKSKRRVTASQLARDYMGPHGQTVSRQTVARALATGSRPLSYQRITKIKRLSRVNKQKRYEFCQQFKPASKLPWVFIDGKVCTLYENGGNGYSFTWWPADEVPRIQPGKLLAYLHFYAAVGKGFRSKLHFVAPTPSIRSGLPKGKEAFQYKDYIKLWEALKPELDSHYGKGRYRIIRDRATQHTKAEKFPAYLKLKVPLVEDYPPQSWDINCIEHVWAQLVRILKGHKAMTVKGFRRAIKVAWQSIPQSCIDALVANVPRRIDRIREVQGEWIDKYSDVMK